LLSDLLEIGFINKMHSSTFAIYLSAGGLSLRETI
jgi:hypothetical protein